MDNSFVGELVSCIDGPCEKVKKFNDDSNALNSYIDEDGAKHGSPISDLKDMFKDVSYALDTPSEVKTKGGNNLKSILENNTNSSNEALIQVAKTIHEGNKVARETAQSIENMGNNVTRIISAVASILNIGNRYKSLSNSIQSNHMSVQTQKNIMSMEKMEYETKPISNLVDMHGQPLSIAPREAKAKKDIETYKNQSFQNQGLDGFNDTEGNQIIPNKAKALKDAEKAIETKDMNAITTDDILEDFFEFFGGLKGDLIDFKDTAAEEIEDLGGFDANVNPFAFMYEAIKEDVNEEIERLKEEQSNG